MKIYKIILWIFILLSILLSILSLGVVDIITPIKYHFSDSYLDAKEIAKLEKGFLKGDCENEHKLSKHIRQSIFPISKKEATWNLLFNTLLCKLNQEKDIYNLRKSEVAMTIYIYKGFDTLYMQNNMPNVYNKFEQYFDSFPEDNICHRVIYRNKKAFSKECLDTARNNFYGADAYEYMQSQ